MIYGICGKFTLVEHAVSLFAARDLRYSKIILLLSISMKFVVVCTSMVTLVGEDACCRPWCDASVGALPLRILVV
jgi:hypothetical protein